MGMGMVVGMGVRSQGRMKRREASRNLDGYDTGQKVINPLYIPTQGGEGGNECGVCGVGGGV
jgi:hypothetical protein